LEILLCIPMHNYSEGVIRILEWAKNSPVLATTDWTTVIYDDHSRSEESTIVRNYLPSFPQDRWRFGVQPVSDNSKLQYAVNYSGTIATTLDFDAVLFCESDAIPNDETLHNMLDVFEHPTDGWDQPGLEAYRRYFVHGVRIDDGYFPLPKNFGRLASVSPVYTWKGDYCYPTQWRRSDWNWLSVNDSGDCYQIKETEQGRIGLARAVPFLFSLWNPECLLKVDSDMPTLHHLDTALGAKVWNEGYINLRLLDHSVEHAGGGGMSRK